MKRTKVKEKKEEKGMDVYQPDQEEPIQFTNKVGIADLTPSRKGKQAGTINTWNTTIPSRAYRLSLLGLNQEELALAFGVSEKTIQSWMKGKPEFRKAVKLGTQEADGRVVQSLYKKATGYAYVEDVINVSHGVITVTPVQKFAHPETTAAIFWLKNRQRGHWSDVTKVEQTIQMDITSNDAKYDMTDFSDEELAILEKIGLKDFKVEN